MKSFDVALLVIRLALGVIFVAHGMQKLFGAFGGSGLGGFAKMLSSQGFKMAEILAWTVALVEFLGGLGLILGILPRLSALGVAIVMIVAILKIHLPNGFFSTRGGFEYQMLLLTVAVAIIISGAGSYSFFNKF